MWQLADWNSNNTQQNGSIMALSRQVYLIFSWASFSSMSLGRMLHDQVSFQRASFCWLWLGWEPFCQVQFYRVHNLECHSAKCHSAKCHSAKCHSAKCHSAKCQSAKCHSAKCHSAKYHSATFRSTECHRLECRLLNVISPLFSELSQDIFEV